MWNLLHPVLAKGEFDKARAIIDKDKSTISQMLGMGLARMGVVRRRSVRRTWPCSLILLHCWDCSAPSWG
jgi:hypothetical protein